MKPLVPTQLETKRLILRQFKDEDWKDLHAYYSDETATKYTVGKAFTEGETWRLMASIIGHWQLRGYGPYAVEVKTTGKVIGNIGFWYPVDFPSPEILWGLASEFHGKGFASEAVIAVQAAGKEYLPEIAFVSFIHKDNTASIKLAEVVGAVFEKELKLKDDMANVYRHP